MDRQEKNIECRNEYENGVKEQKHTFFFPAVVELKRSEIKGVKFEDISEMI